MRHLAITNVEKVPHWALSAAQILYAGSELAIEGMILVGVTVGPSVVQAGGRSIAVPKNSLVLRDPADSTFAIQVPDLI